MNDLATRLQIRYPIIQAPMAGVSTPGLAAAVSNAGALGSIAFAASGAGSASCVRAACGSIDRAARRRVATFAQELNWIQEQSGIIPHSRW